MIADHILEPTGAGSTRARSRYDFHGWLGAPLGVVFGRLSRSYLDREVRALKRRTESR